MMVLTRRLGEGLLIGDDIRVVVVGIRGKSVRLGVAAPTLIAVKRAELNKRYTGPAAADQEFQASTARVDERAPAPLRPRKVHPKLSHH